MQIPKQPRSKPAGGSSETETQSPRGQSPGMKTEDFNKQLQDAYSVYVRNINSASLNAHLEYAKAYLVYLQALQQNPNDVAATLNFWKEILSGQNDAQQVADTYKKAAQASIDQQASNQKMLADAVNTYSQSTREIWEKLQNEVAQQNKEIADALRDALLKIDVGPANLPALSLLYQGLKSMSTPATGGTATPV